MRLLKRNQQEPTAGAVRDEWLEWLRLSAFTIWDAYGDLPLQVIWGWRKDCPCARIK